MNNSVTVAIAQLDLVVGDVSGNTGRIIDAAAKARDDLLSQLESAPAADPIQLKFTTGKRRTWCCPISCSALSMVSSGWQENTPGLMAARTSRRESGRSVRKAARQISRSERTPTTLASSSTTTMQPQSRLRINLAATCSPSVIRTVATFRVIKSLTFIASSFVNGLGFQLAVSAIRSRDMDGRTT